jgi:hypothetical protein
MPRDVSAIHEIVKHFVLEFALTIAYEVHYIEAVAHECEITLDAYDD